MLYGHFASATARMCNVICWFDIYRLVVLLLPAVLQMNLG